MAQICQLSRKNPDQFARNKTRVGLSNLLIHQRESNYAFSRWMGHRQCMQIGQKDRALVTVAAVIPDVDGLGIVAEVLTRHSQKPLTWWSDYHHILGHNVCFCLVFTFAGFLLAHQRWRTAALVFLSIHLHLFCDVIGARGPDGHQWPIPYLLPISGAWQWTWSGQWALNAWQNFVITAVTLVLTFYLAWRRGFSPLEMFSSRGDRAFVTALRRRFPVRSAEAAQDAPRLS
jgi:inner membrane protein